MGELAALSREHAWTEGHQLRYRFDNHLFARGDALALYGILRRFQPAQVVEVGSGFSSALMLDTDEVHLGGRTPFTFIDPYPERLHGLLSDADRDRVTVIENRAELLARSCSRISDRATCSSSTRHTCRASGRMWLPLPRGASAAADRSAGARPRHPLAVRVLAALDE